MSETRRCRHLDVRDFDGLRCCLSRGLAIIEADPGIDVEPPPGSGYQHRPLDHTFGQEIRLVELLPGYFDDELRCNIFHANLVSQEQHDYQAVYWTWAIENGNAELSQTICCGPRRLSLPISDNCAATLRRIRFRGNKRTIWMDIICIDKVNIEERNHQVALMSTIYSKASQVLGYLGEGDKTSDNVFDYVVHQTPHSVSAWDLQVFFSRQWFYRVWVIQEVAMARSATVMIGEKIVHWERFSHGLLEVLKTLPSNEYNSWTAPSAILPALRIGTFFCHRGQDLISLVMATQSCSSTNPRDKVYALLALVSDHDSFPLQADYSRESGWVLVQVAACPTAHNNDLRILRYASKSSSVLTDTSIDWLPSWVPYWPKAVDTKYLLQFSVDTPGDLGK